MGPSGKCVSGFHRTSPWLPSRAFTLMQQQPLNEQLWPLTVTRDAFRDTLGAVCTPLAIVTSQLAARPHGTTVSAFCSLSLAPPLVLVSLDRSSRLLAMIRTTGRFGINVLEHGQQALATRFAAKHDDRFADIAWSMDHGLPRIHGAGSWIACQLENLLEGGDHEIVVGLVEHAEQRARDPLLYQHCTFRRLRWIPLADRGHRCRLAIARRRTRWRDLDAPCSVKGSLQRLVQ